MDVENKAFKYSSFFIGGFSDLIFKSFNKVSSNLLLSYIIHTSFLSLEIKLSFISIIICLYGVFCKLSFNIILSPFPRLKINYRNVDLWITSISLWISLCISYGHPFRKPTTYTHPYPQFHNPGSYPQAPHYGYYDNTNHSLICISILLSSSILISKVSGSCGFSVFFSGFLVAGTLVATLCCLWLWPEPGLEGCLV